MQLLRAVMPPLVGIALCTALALLFGAGNRPLLDTLAALGWIVAAGGMPLVYAAWIGSMIASGLMFKPDVAWSVTCENDIVTVSTPRFSTHVPLDAVASFTQVWEDPWEAIKGMEERCLVMRLRGWRGRIVVPGSSVGYGATITAISATRPIGSRELN